MRSRRSPHLSSWARTCPGTKRCTTECRRSNNPRRGAVSEEPQHVLRADGQFHVEDEAVDVSIYAWEDWVTFALFWIMAAIVFYQVYTRYVLSDSAGWTEEIARYFL